MANMYMVCLIFVLTMTVVHCATQPDCTSLTCATAQHCGWTCIHTGTQGSSGNTTNCTTANTCTIGGTTGTCTPICLPKSGTPPANHTVAPNRSGTPPANHTVAPNVNRSGKNGSIRHGVSSLMLMCVIFTKLFLRP
ncbi:uncharacterized protein LOC110459742 [Mizuhopecten yessoensis]|uniref:uncharacterized protein LOC110459742 n=1 Tax=Mizuhopecten yessoensis TaxID=6573 RepID=UPI000B45992A|nr:uncharacterized protein LOC110459742 [Mizuhopecten yessoensis]